MTNRLKEMGESAAWHLMVSAALEGAKQQGYSLKRQPGRGLSNTYEVTKDGKTQVASVRTTRDRYIAFPPLDGGKRWKTLDDADLVLVSAVDDPANPQNVDVYMFPAEEVRKRFDASYAARIANKHTVRDNYGMWVMLDKGDDKVVSQIGHSLAVDYPRIAHFTIDELQASADPDVRKMADETPVVEEEAGVREVQAAGPTLDTVADVLSFARERIAALTGMPEDAVKLDLKMGV
ncbi:MAG TPA: hypothetical protein VGR19_11975 [Allosphingosinicella sp.]|nr:hypothetical protein [Allosphingosinicella sp.]